MAILISPDVSVFLSVFFRLRPSIFSTTTHPIASELGGWIAEHPCKCSMEGVWDDFVMPRIISPKRIPWSDKYMSGTFLLQPLTVNPSNVDLSPPHISPTIQKIC